MKLIPGELIAHTYRLERPLGEGGFGVVWVATQLGLNRAVAIKFLKGPRGGQEEKRFELEAQALARLDDPNCVMLFDFGRLNDGRVFLVTELLVGPGLSEWALTAPLEQLLDVARQITSALAAAHRANILHRDLKPENIIVLSTPGGPRAKVLDFGIAKISGTQLVDVTKTGEVFGTPGYMSPEQLRARAVGPRSDLYALGAVLFGMIEGRDVFEAKSALELAMLHLRAVPPPIQRADVPASIRALVAALLAKDQNDRPTSAMAVIAALSGEATPPVPAAVALAESPAVGSVWVTVVAVGAVLVVGVAIFALSHSAPGPGPPRVPAALTEVARAPVPAPSDVGFRTHDTGALDAAQADLSGLRVGCRRPHPGVGVVVLVDGLTVYIPSTYDPRRPSPVLLIFHDTFQGAETVVSSVDIRGMAESAGFVVIAPSDASAEKRWSRGDHRRVLGQLRFAQNELCLDETRYFVLGMGGGGSEAHRFGCEVEGVKAFVTSGFRFDARDDVCGGKRPPLLFIATLDDPYEPLAGGAGCLGIFSPATSVDQHEAELRKVYGCEPRTEQPGCVSPKCDRALEICRIEGGRFWPGLEAKQSTSICPSASNTTFGYPERVLEFFRAHDDRL